jgi:two-component system LytT family response regulator
MKMNNETLRVIIVEDERPAREIIKAYLKEFPQLDLVAECENGFDGAMLIRKEKPDIVFLDIQMPKLTGFEMLELLENRPLIIFTTAYDEFAIRAFEVNAVDYLLKPFLVDRFKQAVEKALATISQESRSDNEQMVSYIRSQQEIINRIVVKVKNRIEILLVKQLEHFEAQDDYVYIYTFDSERFIKDLTMKYLENHLPPSEFVRVHRSHIVRIDRISRIESENSDSHLIYLKSGSEVPMSRSGYRRLKQIMGV